MNIIFDQCSRLLKDKLCLGSLVLALSILSGCSSGTTSPVPVQPPITSPPTGTVPVETSINTHLRKLSFNPTTINTRGKFEVTLGENDVSVLINLRVNDNTKAIFITEIREPGGAIIYSGPIVHGDVPKVTSGFTNAPILDESDLSVFLPAMPRIPIKPGTYNVEVETEDNTPLTNVSIFIKGVSDSEDFDKLHFKLNLNIWVAHPDAAFSSIEFQTLVKKTYKDSINQILAPHNLNIADINFYFASPAEVTRFSTLDAEEDFGAACRAMQAATGERLALNLGYIESIYEEEDLGTAGISPTPGVIMDKQSANGCFFIAQSAYIPDEELSEIQANQMQASNILHELGHFMTLNHPTESDGLEFDLLDDTAQCALARFEGNNNITFGVPGELDEEVSDHECGVEGGAKNFLFYGGHQDFLPFEMSKDQAWVLRRHPLAIQGQ